MSWFVFHCCDEHHDPKAMWGGKGLVRLIASHSSWKEVQVAGGWSLEAGIEAEGGGGLLTGLLLMIHSARCVTQLGPPVRARHHPQQGESSLISLINQENTPTGSPASQSDGQAFSQSRFPVPRVICCLYQVEEKKKIRRSLWFRPFIYGLKLGLG